MLVATLTCSAVMAILASEPAAAASEDLQAYRAASARAGRDPDAHVRLALWCESHGLAAERVKHLALAVLIDPNQVTARGLLGLVAYRDRWRRPDEVAAQVEADAGLAASLAEYNARRERAPQTQEAQWKLALWCEQEGLKAEAQAHFSAVTQLPPRSPRHQEEVVNLVHPDLPADHRAAAWKRLGCRVHHGRWMTEAQIRAEQAEAEAQQKADRRWRATLVRWRGQLADRHHRAEAEAALAGVDDPRAVPAVVRGFGAGGAGDQAWAVQLLGQIDAPAATRALAMLALDGIEPEVRRAATETLRRRDPREFAGLLIGLLHDPLKYQARPVGGPGSPGELRIEGEEIHLKRRYAAPRARGGDSDRYRKLNLEEAETAAFAAEQQLLDDVAWIEGYNASVRVSNPVIAQVLGNATGQDLGTDREAWRAWYFDLLGYRYTRPESKPTYTQQVPPLYRPRYHCASCFGAGTPVQTLTGLRPIESLRVGDLVLSQDTHTGALRYQPIVGVHHNPPSATLVLRLGGERIVSSTYHRFWKPGRGWVMARELKPGDTIRTLAGPTRVDAVADGGVHPVFNLDVADDRDFFVGGLGALVHDNSLPSPVREPFDAAPTLAALNRGD